MTVRKTSQRIISALLVLLIIGSFTHAYAASAADMFEFEYDDQGSTAVITGCNTSISGDIVIPAEINGYSVIGISNNAFLNCEKITSVTIPETVEYIDYYAFKGCFNLTKIEADKNNPYFSSDENGVLFNTECSRLLIYPAGLQLKEYTVPDTVSEIVSFSNNSFLESVVFSDNLEEIYHNAFENCTSLINISLPDGCKAIGARAFAGCSNLKSAKLSATVNELGPEAFMNCKNLESLEIPDGIDAVNSNTFNGCTGLKSIKLSESLKEIGWGAFSGCTNLESIEIPNGVTTIDSAAFEECDSLTSIVIPDSVTEFGVDGNVAADGMPFPAIFKSCDNLESVKLPAALKEIGNGFFYECINLTTVENMSDITKIGYGAFNGCKNLSEITISKETVTIDDFAFFGCINLEKLIFEEGSKLEYIGNNSFCNAKFETIYIPENVSYIGNNAFSANSHLKFIEVDENNKHYSNDEHGVLYNKNKTTLMQAPGVKEGTDTYIVPNTVTEIHERAFMTSEWLKKLHLPMSVNAVTVFTKAPLPSLIEDIYYEGTIEEFNQIKDIDLISHNATIHPNSYCAAPDTPVVPDEPKELESIDGSKSPIKIYPENGAYDGEVFVDYKEIDLNKNEVDELEAEYARLSTNTGAKAVITYDIKVVRKDDNGEFIYADINEGKKVKVKIPAPDGYDKNKTYVILHKLSNVQNENNKLVNYIGKTTTEEINGKVYFVIDVEHFSNFIIMEVEKKPVSSISIASRPKKTSYTYKNGSLDLSGLALTVTYSDGTTETITDTSKMKATGFDNSKTGTQAVTVEYEGCAAKFDVTVSYAWWQWIIRILLLGFLWY